MQQNLEKISFRQGMQRIQWTPEFRMEAMWSLQRKNTKDLRYVSIWKFKLNRHRSKKRTSVPPGLHTLSRRRMHRKEEAQKRNIRQKDHVLYLSKGRRIIDLGKKPMKFKGLSQRKTKSKYHKTQKSQIKVIVTEILKRLRKSKEKGLGICFHIFTKVVYRIAIWEESQNHCSYSRKCGTEVPRRSVCTVKTCTFIPWSNFTAYEAVVFQKQKLGTL